MEKKGLLSHAINFKYIQNLFNNCVLMAFLIISSLYLAFNGIRKSILTHITFFFWKISLDVALWAISRLVPAEGRNGAFGPMQEPLCGP